MPEDMNNRMIPTAKDFFNKQTPHVCNTLAHLKFYYEGMFCNRYRILSGFIAAKTLDLQIPV